MDFKNGNELLVNNIVVDAHNDFLSDVIYLRSAGKTKVIENKYLPIFRSGHVNVVVAAIFIENIFIPGMVLERALHQISCLKYEMEESQGLFRLCTTYSEIEEAIKSNEIAILLSLECASPIQNNFDLLRIFYDLGVRFLGPAWARRNYVVDGSVISSNDNKSAGTFTEFGIRVIKEAERLGMTLDISHLTDNGAKQIDEYINGVYFASHSNTRFINNIERNLPDELIEKVSVRGGVIGVNFVNTIVAQSDQESTISRVIDHIEHIVKIGGEDCVGIGADFFENLPCVGPLFEKGFETRDISDVIKGYAGFPEFVELMIERGFTKGFIRKLIGGNFMRMFKQVL